MKHGVIASLTFLLCTFSIVYAAISWPSSAPSGETTGGKFATVISSILSSGDWKNPGTGVVKKASEVAFEGFSYCTTGLAITPGWQAVVLPILEYNTFSGTPYNTTNSAFTAPKTGYYEFVLGGYSPTAATSSDRYGLGIRINSVVHQFWGGNFSAIDTPLSTYTNMVKLNVGSVVVPWVASGINATLWISFEGHGFCFQGRYLGQ